MSRADHLAQLVEEDLRLPGRVRQSIVADALPGMTFVLVAASSRVGLAVLRTVAPIRFAIGPSFAIASSGSSGSSSMPSASRHLLQPAPAGRGDDHRETMATRGDGFGQALTALSSFTNDRGRAGRGRASRSQSMPFSASR
jgi:hypothetical protein